MNEGKVTQVIGPVVDIEFEFEKLPALYNAVRILRPTDGKDGQNHTEIIVEVAQHLGENTVRAVAMQPTEGLMRGLKAVDTGAPISVPVGTGVLGRILNVLGEPVDNMGPVQYKERYPIHRPAPSFSDQDTGTEVLETGIKVIDLL